MSDDKRDLFREILPGGGEPENDVFVSHAHAMLRHSRTFPLQDPHDPARAFAWRQRHDRGAHGEILRGWNWRRQFCTPRRPGLLLPYRPAIIKPTLGFPSFRFHLLSQEVREQIAAADKQLPEWDSDRTPTPPQEIVAGLPPDLKHRLLAVQSGKPLGGDTISAIYKQITALATTIPLQKNVGLVLHAVWEQIDNQPLEHGPALILFQSVFHGWFRDRLDKQKRLNEKQLENLTNALLVIASVCFNLNFDVTTPDDVDSHQHSSSHATPLQRKPHKSRFKEDFPPSLPLLSPDKPDIPAPKRTPERKISSTTRTGNKLGSKDLSALQTSYAPSKYQKANSPPVILVEDTTRAGEESTSGNARDLEYALHSAKGKRAEILSARTQPGNIPPSHQKTSKGKGRGKGKARLPRDEEPDQEPREEQSPAEEEIELVTPAGPVEKHLSSLQKLIENMEEERQGRAEIHDAQEATLQKTTLAPCSSPPAQQSSETSEIPEDVPLAARHDDLIYIRWDGRKEDTYLPLIRSLISKDLSEPYSIYVYRYFLYQWGHLCYMAFSRASWDAHKAAKSPDDAGSKLELIGVIINKLEPHRDVALRGYIAMLAVQESHRGRGIATHLVKMAVQRMTELDADEIALETELGNTPSLKLYKRLGFIRSKRLHRYYLNGNGAFRLILALKEPKRRERSKAEARKGLGTTEKVRNMFASASGKKAMDLGKMMQGLAT